MSAPRTEQALPNHASLLETLFATCPLPILVDGVDGRVTLVNPAFCDVFGYAEAECLGRTPAELIVPDEHLAGFEEARRTAIAGATVQGTGTRQRKNGGLLDIEFHAAPILADGKCVGTFVMYQDITARVKVEREALQRLRDAKETAERANRDKSRFLAQVSDGIRTPASGVIGMTDLVLDTDLTDEQRECLTRVKRSVHSLSGILDDILDFSTQEAWRLQVEAVPFSPREHLADLLAPLACQAERKHLELIGQLLPDVPDVIFGDPDRLRQVLVNLVDNALKFTERGGVRVLVYVEPQQGDGVFLHYAVTDSGIGVPRDKQQLIFQPCHQAAGSPPRFGGTGLGLASSTSLVDLMGGNIWVDSQLHQGSTFHFTARVRVPSLVPGL